MGEIYFNSSQGLVWLGKCDDTSRKAIDAMQIILEDLASKSHNFANLQNILLGPDGKFRTVTAYEVPHFDWRSLVRFFANPWFSRRWIIQEASLPAHSLCHFGSFEFSLNDPVMVAAWLYVNRQCLPFMMRDYDGLGNVAELWVFADRAYLRLDEFMTSTTVSSRIYFNSVFVPFETFDQSEPRDRVYGIAGLFDILFKHGSKPHPLIVPDYRKPVHEVLRDATRFAVFQCGALRTLRYRKRILQPGQASVEAPSWVPEWLEKWHPATHTYDISRLGRKVPFRTCAGESMDVALTTCTRDANVITFEGFPVGNIVEFSEVITGPALERAEHLNSALDDMEHLLGLVSETTPYADIKVAFAHTITAGKRVDKDNDNSCVVVDEYGRLREYLNRTGRMPPERYQSSPDELLNENHVSVMTFCDDVYYACRNRRFFTTDTGRIGLGPQTMKCGDQATVLYGSNIPYILRCEAARCAMIGECYVNGFMYGEAVEERRAEGKVGVEDIKYHLQ